MRHVTKVNGARSHNAWLLQQAIKSNASGASNRIARLQQASLTGGRVDGDLDTETQA